MQGRNIAAFVGRLFAAASIAIGGAPAAPPAAERCTLTPIAELPVTMDGRRALVKAHLNGVESWLLADSGAFLSMLSPATVERLGLERGPAPGGLAIGGVGGAIPVDLARVEDIRIGGRKLAAMTFLVGPTERSIGGLLGQNILANADAEFDLGGGMIRLVEPARCNSLSLAEWGLGRPVSQVRIAPLSETERHVTGTATIAGVPLRAVFDSGAPTTLLSLAAARRAGIGPETPGVYPAGATNGLNGSIGQSWIAPSHRYRLGAIELTGDPLRIADLGQVPFDLLIGADFFLSHRVLVANAQHRLYFTDMTTKTGEPLPALKSADSYGRRGTALAARRDFEHAVADFTRAIELAPGEPHFLVARAAARRDRGESLLARQDLDAALAMRPDDVEALLTRATIHLAEGDRAAARPDLERASRAALAGAEDRFALGAAFAALEDWRRSRQEFDLWIASHPTDDRIGVARNARCWALAMVGEGLAQAREDCDAAVRSNPEEPAYRDSRGLVRLRLGDLDGAIADYDAALRARPDLAWSIYGRGIARLRKGREADGVRDLAAARAIDPSIGERFAAIGILR